MLRKFTKTDAKECSRIMNACQNTMPEFNGKQVQFLVNKYTPEYIGKEYPKHFSLVMEDKGKIRGVGLLIKNEVRGLYIDPDYHRAGCGSAILKGLEEMARKRGLTKIITKSYFGAEKFYEKMEFKKIKKDAAIRGPISFPYILMEKSLK